MSIVKNCILSGTSGHYLPSLWLIYIEHLSRMIHFNHSYCFLLSFCLLCRFLFYFSGLLLDLQLYTFDSSHVFEQNCATLSSEPIHQNEVLIKPKQDILLFGDVRVKFYARHHMLNKVSYLDIYFSIRKSHMEKVYW